MLAYLNSKMNLSKMILMMQSTIQQKKLNFIVNGNLALLRISWQELQQNIKSDVFSVSLFGIVDYDKTVESVQLFCSTPIPIRKTTHPIRVSV